MSSVSFLHDSARDVHRVFTCGVSVKPAKVGLGVFSFAFIPVGNAIGRVRGKIYTDPEYTSDYCIDAGDDKTLEPLAPFCYINHCCTPNCILMQYVSESECDGTEHIGALTDTETDTDGCSNSHTTSYSETNTNSDTNTSCREEWDDDIDEETDEYDDPDIALLKVDESDEAHGVEIWVESLRDILPGEELTIDYSWPASRAMRCLCGSPQCRGWIVDPAERDELYFDT